MCLLYAHLIKTKRIKGAANLERILGNPTMIIEINTASELGLDFIRAGFGLGIRSSFFHRKGDDLASHQ